MKQDKDLRITIIGMGNLLEAIFYLFSGAVGRKNLAGQVNATTADEADLERKRRLFGIPILLNDNLAAMRELEPDIIVFAPPPTEAPSIIRNELKTYFDGLRAASKPLPDLYAFPPVPLGAFYRETLGDDVLVVNIIPNNISAVGGKPVRGEGFYAHTFPAPWPEEHAARFRSIFAPNGAGVELKPSELVPMLGGVCTIFSLWVVVPVIGDFLAEGDLPLLHQDLGEYMRARVQNLYGFQPEESDPCSLDAVPADARPALDAVVSAWHDGLEDYYREIDFPTRAAEIILTRGMDITLHTVQKESRDILNKHAVVAATKGGVLEKAIACFHDLTEDVIRRGLQTPDDPAWKKTLREKVTETAHIVRKHGQTLAG